jgi:hypothetical protein
VRKTLDALLTAPRAGPSMPDPFFGSFQSLELFESLTVAENLQSACDPGGWRRYVSDLVHPRRARRSQPRLPRFGSSPWRTSWAADLMSCRTAVGG